MKQTFLRLPIFNAAEPIRGFVEFHGAHRPAEKLRRDSDKFCARKPALDLVIDGIPPGNYSLAAWHEKLGEKTIEITVGPGKSSEVIFVTGRS